MIATAGKKTYGLVSQTILNALGTDGTNKERGAVFCVYMYWGIIMGYPGAMSEKKQFVADMLQRLTEQCPFKSAEDKIQKLKMLFANPENSMLEIYLNSIAPAVPLTLQWTKDWQHHCASLFHEDASPDTCFYLFFVIQDSLELDITDQFAVIYLINETMRYDTRVS